MMAYLPSLFGGMLLGLSALVLLITTGRIAGISGILGHLLGGGLIPGNLAFAIGLLAGPLLYATTYGSFPAVTMVTAWPPVLIAGLLVGIGTRMGSGCTSGHGILGLARFSKRSLAATATFLAAGIATATAMGMLQ